MIRRLQIPDEDLQEMGTFQGINPRNIQPKGKITLPVTLGSDQNNRTEKVDFDIADNPFAYNGILGRPALAKFMVASQYAYNTVKMPGPVGVIIINADKRDALICTNRLFREAVATSTAKVPSTAAETPGENKAGKRASRADPGKHASPERYAADKDAPESSIA